jgi:DNA-binding transcriptional MerR regulator
MSEPGSSVGVYGISVAAELTGLTVRSLRLFERHGLLRPARTTGGTRRFSGDDLRRTRRIAELLAEGINFAGIGRILDLELDGGVLRDGNADLREQNAALRSEQDSRRPSDDGRHPSSRGWATEEADAVRRRSPLAAAEGRGRPSRPG